MSIIGMPILLTIVAVVVKFLQQNVTSVATMKLIPFSAARVSSPKFLSRGFMK